MPHDHETIAQIQIDEMRRDIDRLDDRMQAHETRLARLEGRTEERDERTLRTAEQRAFRERRELATKIIGGTVTVALAVVSAVVSIVTAAKC
jgi:hypothetical protein